MQKLFVCVRKSQMQITVFSEYLRLVILKITRKAPPIRLPNCNLRQLIILTYKIGVENYFASMGHCCNNESKKGAAKEERREV